MFSYRITTYNPANRDPHGVYLIDEWISYSEIGSIVGGKEFTYDEYIKIENAYFSAVLLFMECNALETLKIANLEKRKVFDHQDPYVTEDMKTEFTCAADGIEINKKQIDLMARLVLREKLWCRLESNNMFVHFGWDYYMYIGSFQRCEECIKKIQDSELFVEDYQSPYLDEDE